MTSCSRTVVPSEHSAIVRPRPAGSRPLPLCQSETNRVLNGVWISPGGSRYLSDGEEFVCISVHHSRFAGWIGKTAIAQVRFDGEHWIGRQAIREMATGRLCRWVPLTLSIQEDLIVKSFPTAIPAHQLVHGYTEHYRRARM